MNNLTWMCIALLCVTHSLVGQSEECPIVFDNLDLQQISSTYSDVSNNSYYYQSYPFPNTSGVLSFYLSEPTTLSTLDLAILQIPYYSGGGDEEEEEGINMTPSYGMMQHANIGIGGADVTANYSFNNIPFYNSEGYVTVHRMDLSGTPYNISRGEYVPGEGMLLQPGNYNLYVSIYYANNDYSSSTYLTGNFDLYGCEPDNSDRDGDGILNEDDNCPDLVDTEAPHISSSFKVLGDQKGDKADLAIGFSGTDNCDSEIDIDAFIKLPDIEGYSVEYKTKSKYKVKVDSKKQKVSVEGPDPGPFWDMVSGNGGFAVEVGDNFEFKGKEIKEGKDKYEFKFSDTEELTEVKGPVCMLYCEATDQAGNTGHSLTEFMIEEDAMNKNREVENNHLVNTGIDDNLDGIADYIAHCDFYAYHPCLRTSIKNVTLEDINNSSHCGENGYSDFRNISTELVPGTEYTLSIARATGKGTGATFAKVFVDWNLDGDFNDPGENIVTTRLVSEVTFRSFTVPHSATGSYTIRVAVDWRSYPSSCNSRFGEAEDYTIITCVDPIVNITESELPLYCQENSKSLTANVDNNSGNLTYSWSTGSTDKSINVQTSGIYSVTVADKGCASTASYSVTVVPENLLSSYTIIAEEDVHLHGNNVLLNGGIGVLDDKGKVKIHDESFVTGGTTFVQSDKIEIDNDSGVTNGIQTASTVELPPAYYNLNDSDNDVTVDKNTIVTLYDQVYGKIDVKEGSTVIFTETDLFINDLKTKEDVTLIFPSCAFVRIEKKLDFHKNVKVNPDDGHQVQFFVDDNVDVKEGSTINASIDARGHDIKVKGKDDNPTYMNGRFIAKKVHGDKYVSWDWGTACNATCFPEDMAEIITENSNKNRKVEIGQKINNLFELKVYPNPASESVNFILPQSSSESQLILFDVTGRILWQTKLNTEKTMSTKLDISTYNKGLYFVKLVQGEEFKIQKLIISK